MVPIKTRYTTSESQSMLYIFKKKSWKKPRRHCLSWQPFSATFTFCCFGSIRQFMSFKDVSELFPSWGWEFWWLTSRETWPPVVWPQEMGWHWRGWQPSITDGAMGPATVCSPAFLYFVLLEIQYTFIFSLSSPHFTTRTEPTKTHGSSMRHNRSWVLYEILSMATNCNRSAVSLLLQMTRSSEWPER